eukprot:1913675-Ditylum_brightwellii.AAC.1
MVLALMAGWSGLINYAQGAFLKAMATNGYLWYQTSCNGILVTVVKAHASHGLQAQKNRSMPLL